MALKEYKVKRNFKSTSEPSGEEKSSKGALKFVVQKHAAASLHYDFRLELNGVLKSWAVPKGPSLNPEDKRLAMMVEDHPYDYRDFEGIIPEGNYGAGEVIVWDEGTYHALFSEDKKESIKLLNEGLAKGDLKFFLHGQKLNGGYALVKMKGRGENSWLLIKKKDEFATGEDITQNEESVKTGKTLQDLKSGDGAGKKKIRETKQVKAPPVSLSKSVEKKMPSGIKPMLATLIDKPFNDKEWLFEIKWDGYRAVAEINNGNINLHSRNMQNFNEKFSAIADELASIDRNVILDGEVVVLDDKGKSDFQLLQNYQRTGEGNIVYYIFDILYIDNYDLRESPLFERKKVLKEFLGETDKVRYSDHVMSDGIPFFEIARENKLEGIIAKKINSKYQTGKRSKEWLKIKTQMRQEAVIAGFTKPKGSRKSFGALVLGVYENNNLIYIGHTGGGFDDAKLKSLKAKLEPSVVKKSPFDKKIKTNTPVTWVEPKFVCEVTFSEWTQDGRMRQPIFLGLREDKKPQDVVKEIPRDVLPDSEEPDAPAAPKKEKEKEVKSKKEKKEGNSDLKFSNLSKVYFPKDSYTKGDLINYYDSISKYMLPYIKDRPQSLNRHPNGINKSNFFQKDMGNTAPAWAKTVEVYSDSNDKNINYFVCTDKNSLLYLVNLGCIEINPWFSRVGSLENPDYAVLDLDPEDIGFDKVIETAIAAKEVLDDAGAKSFCKTSGATGLHIYIPLKAKYDYETAKEFTHLIGKIVNSKLPDFTSLERSPSKRQRKVYLDYLQNRTGQTLAAPYSVRPRDGAPVATPLDWKEVKPGLEPGQFNIKNTGKRLEKKGDIFKAVLGTGIDIEKCITRLMKKYG